MLDWTGERFVPWAREAAVAYEHLHRYIWASTLVSGKRVLDLASGEGYGANILAGNAAYVCGVDVDDAVIQHARSRYCKPNLEFLKAPISAVPISESSSFDVVVCFEAIEHIDAQESLVREASRLLRPDGLFIVSTPNKAVYRIGGEEPNPYHVKELTFDEFHALLSPHFPEVLYFGQDVHPGSIMWPIGVCAGEGLREFAITRVDEEFQLLPDKERVALYLVAVASRGPGAAGLRGSALVDYSDELIKERVEAFRAQIRQRDEALDWRASQVDALERSNQELAANVQSLQGELGRARQELDEIHQSRGWKWVLKLRALRDRFSGVMGG
jgi:SAM-dependent methyltransferase